MKKKILIGTVNLEIGGIEKTLIGLLNHIDYSKYEIDLLVLKTNGELIKDIPSNVNIITPYKTNFLKRICNSKNVFCKIINHLLLNHFVSFFYKTNKEYDTAISYSGYYPFIDYYIKNVKANKKLIWVHTDLSTFDDKFIYKLRYVFTKNKYKYFDNIICVSDSVKDSFIKMLPKYKDKVLVQWNIVDINKNNYKYPKLTGKYKILFVGRLCSAKRVDKLIEVHKKLIDNNMDITTYIVGDGELKNQLTELAKELKVTNTLKFLGKQNNILEIMKQADLFVLPSDYEGFGIVLLESLHSNLPFVGTDVCGIKDVAKKIAPKGSYLIAENNVEDIYNKIVDAKNGKVSKNFKFSLEEYNKKCMKDFYQKIK